MPSTQLPNLLCIGAPKCGTSWLASLLSQHPEFYLHPQKELNVLHYDDCFERLDEYQHYFAEVGDQHTARADFSVRYMASRNAPTNAAQLVPDAKILVILRDPVDQIQSHYWHLARQNFHQPSPVKPVPDIEEALQRFPDLLLEPALYAKHLHRWLQLFPPEQMLVIPFDALIEDTGLWVGKIESFLGIASLPLAPVTVERQGVSPKSQRSAALFPWVYTLLAKPYQVIKEVFGVERADSLKRRLKIKSLIDDVFFDTEYPKISDEVEYRLKNLLMEDTQLLAKLAVTGEEFTWLQR